MKRKKFIAQGGDVHCFVYAAANLLIALKRDVPPLGKAKKMHDKEGDVTLEDQKEILAYMGLRMRRTKNMRSVLNRGGILVVSHPLWFMHAFAVVPENNIEVLVLNSWFGPTAFVWAKVDIVTLLEPCHDALHWVLLQERR